MQRLALTLLIGLAGCTESRFEFRGWSDLSSCREVIDTELANGGEFESAYDSTDPESPGHVTELASALYEIPARIDITCTPRGRIAAVQYIVRTRNPDETGAAFERIAGELVPLFGEPYADASEDSRTLNFGCAQSAPVMLEEWRSAEDEHETYLAIVPSAIGCLAP